MTTQKKSFKDDNPAMQFISPIEYNTDNMYNTDNTLNTSDIYNTYNTSDTSSTVKRHRAPNTHERKTKRLNLLVQPSSIEALNKVAYIKRSSINDLINTLIREYVSKEAEAIAQYDHIFHE